MDLRLLNALALALALGALAGRARAQGAGKPVAPTATGAITQSLAVLGLDALGIDEERVRRLDSLFRIELARLAGRPLPTPRDIALKLKGTKLGDCSGETKCLAAIGKKLGVDLVVSGNVASLGDSYVVNIKVVDSATETELRRISSDPLRGESDELIEPIRVAAYRLLAPDELHGSIAVLADLKGARVELDGKVMGMTPLTAPIRGLELGVHKLRVTSKGYSDFQEEVTVRFQKTSRVVVRLVTPEPKVGDPVVVTRKVPAEPRWYHKPWFYVAVGVGAVVVGGIVGWQLSDDGVIDCTDGAGSPECGGMQ